MLVRQMFKLRPNSVESQNAISVVHMLQKSDSAIVYQERAHKLNPSDRIVIHNIAEFYKQKRQQEKTRRIHDERSVHLQAEIE